MFWCRLTFVCHLYPWRYTINEPSELSRRAAHKSKIIGEERASANSSTKLAYITEKWAK